MLLDAVTNLRRIVFVSFTERTVVDILFADSTVCNLMVHLGLWGKRMGLPGFVLHLNGHVLCLLHVWLHELSMQFVCTVCRSVGLSMSVPVSMSMMLLTWCAAGQGGVQSGCSAASPARASAAVFREGF